MGTIITRSLLSALLPVAIMGATPAEMNSAGDSGASAANNTRNFFTNGFTSNIDEPLTSNSGIMSTVDGSQTFGGTNISCASAVDGEFLSLSYVTDPLSEIHLSVQFDKDMDGVPEISTVSWINAAFAAISPKNISGVCGDGVVSCDPGQWSNCSFYKFEYSGSKIILAESMRSVGQLASCQCTNISCQSPSNTQAESLLSLMGNAIFNLVYGEDPGLIVSDVSMSGGNTLVYHGQDVSSCSGAPKPNDYAGATLEEKGMNAKADMLSDPNSAVSIVEGSSYVQSNPPIDGMATFLDGKFGDGIDAADADSIAGRSKTIHENTNGSYSGNGMAMSYTDTDANGLTTSDSAGIYARSDSVLFCQVQWAEEGSAVFSDGENAQTVETGLSEVLNLQTRMCDNMTCPVDASKGETIKFNCGEIDNFAEVSVEMEAAHQATKDMICSTHAP